MVGRHLEVAVGALKYHLQYCERGELNGRKPSSRMRSEVGVKSARPGLFTARLCFDYSVFCFTYACRVFLAIPSVNDLDGCSWLSFSEAVAGSPCGPAL